MKKRNNFVNKIFLSLIMLTFLSIPAYSFTLFPEDATINNITIQKAQTSGDITLIVESIIQTDRVYNTLCYNPNSTSVLPYTPILAESLSDSMFKREIMGENTIRSITNEKETYYIINLKFIKATKASLTNPSITIKMPEVRYKRDKFINNKIEQVEEIYIYEGNTRLTDKTKIEDQGYGVGECFRKNIFRTNWPHEESGQILIKGYKEYFPEKIEFDSKENEFSIDLPYCQKTAECSNEEICINSQCKILECNAGHHANNHSCLKSECLRDNDCKIEQTCSNYICKELLCGYGSYVANHQCEAYECMDNANCEYDSVCFNHTCLPLNCNTSSYAEEHTCFPYECKINEDCSNKEICDRYKCKVLNCAQKQVARNHTCLELKGIAKFAYEIRLRIINWFS